MTIDVRISRRGFCRRIANIPSAHNETMKLKRIWVEKVTSGLSTEYSLFPETKRARTIIGLRTSGDAKAAVAWTVWMHQLALAKRIISTANPRVRFTSMEYYAMFGASAPGID